MTDPERISQRGAGLAAHLLQAGKSELPDDASVERTLRALGGAGVLLSTSAAASGAKVSSAATAAGGAGAGVAGSAAAAGSTAKAVSAIFLVKWIGIGVVGGLGLASAAVVASGSSTPKPPVVAVREQAPRAPSVPAPVVPAARSSVVADEPAPVALPAPTLSAPRPSANVLEPEATPPALDEGAPLAAEVASVDRARSQLAAGQAAQALATLQGYEQQFPAARLLPEVLFLRLEAGERLGRSAEARAAAQRLVDGFPESPHASSARKLLGP